MGALGPNILVAGDEAKKDAQLFNVLWRKHGKDCLDLFGVRFDTLRGKPMAKEIGFLNGRFEFTRVDNEAFFFKSSQGFFYKFHVRIEALIKTSNIVYVYFDVNDIMEHKFHYFLSNVEQLTYSHG